MFWNCAPLHDNVWNSKTHDEFELGGNWEDLLTTHELKENEWVKPFYDIQHMDTSIYASDVFLAE